MSRDYVLEHEGSFHIKDYNRTAPFSNFLPGIAGAWGVPVWVFYVNRAQGVISFGLQDKDHCIGEFFPANKAYALVSSIGFRTFLKINGATFHEPFRVVSGHKRDEEMIIESDSLTIRKVNHHLGLAFTIRYFTMPNAPVGGLVRVFSIRNISDKPVDLEIVDGLPRIIPFGANNLFLKDLARTLEAWMHCSVKNNLALFRLIVDPVDASQTKLIEGANFNYSFYEKDGLRVYPYHIVDPDILFGHDQSYAIPVKFLRDDFKTPCPQIDCGKTPCAFSHFTWHLASGQEKVFYSMFGASFKLTLIEKFVANVNAAFLAQKEAENKKIIRDIKTEALCVSSSRELSHYVGQTYLDNVLRGGWPYSGGGKESYYIFSRKHGDLERDYNRFKLLPSYFSEGEANYRDINQNRRMDLFFNPALERKNVSYFLNFIKLDGYNPLVVRGEHLFFKEAAARTILKEFSIAPQAKLIALLTGGFALGEFFKFLKEGHIEVKNREDLARRIIEAARREPVASFGEGYWIDHWRYNLDLVESFLYFYPDKLLELFTRSEYYFWDDEHRVKERCRRYYDKDSKVYQWHSLEAVDEKKAAIAKRGRFKNFMRTAGGDIYKTSLTVKLLSLILNKAATLDPEGIGVEMEADKPGWCDSLNGLPALLGSSVCETFEIKRACLILRDALGVLKKKGVATVPVAREIASFMRRLKGLLLRYQKSGRTVRDYLWWEHANCIKEDFRKKTFFTIEGKEDIISCSVIEKFLDALVKKLDDGIGKARNKKTGLYTTYFRYEVTKYRVVKKGLLPRSFLRRDVALFLEGFVGALRVQRDHAIYKALRASVLFDRKLAMYRLNASLAREPLEIGRSRIFVPGWLENETVWLHMEYKYLLEVLKSGFYEEFYRDFHNCCVCFFEPSRYGRNVLENSSFIVSSVHPDKSLWGKGFVARLSGATVEFLNIWVILCLGPKPFSVDCSGNVCLEFSPILKGDLFTRAPETIEYGGLKVTFPKDIFAFTLFSSTLVVYHNPSRKDTFKGCVVKRVVIEESGRQHIIKSSVIETPLAQRIREQKAQRIDIYLE
ncbi:MAG: cellobiose phosphorylase [Candidatus Omnitrophota bacterium]|nr:cellobiose phosphorylase [Candidatus Omnitrophota bacterium]